MKKKDVALSTWENLVSIKKEAVDKLIEIVPNMIILDAEVKNVEMSPAFGEKDLEELEVFLILHLCFHIKAMDFDTLEQIMKLLTNGEIKVLEYTEKETRIEYKVSYTFEYDDEIGKSREGAFSG